MLDYLVLAFEAKLGSEHHFNYIDKHFDVVADIIHSVYSTYYVALLFNFKMD